MKLIICGIDNHFINLSYNYKSNFVGSCLKNKNTVSMCILWNIYFLKGVQFTAELPDGPLEAKFDMIRVVCCLSLFVCDLNL